MFGIEADGAWSDIKFAETNLGVMLEDRIRSFGSVTGRLGYAVDAARRLGAVAGETILADFGSSEQGRTFRSD